MQQGHFYYYGGKHNSIRDVGLLERIIAYIKANVETIFTTIAISKYLKSEGRTVAPETILIT